MPLGTRKGDPSWVAFLLSNDLNMCVQIGLSNLACCAIHWPQARDHDEGATEYVRGSISSKSSLLEVVVNRLKHYVLRPSAFGFLSTMECGGIGERGYNEYI